LLLGAAALGLGGCVTEQLNQGLGFMVGQPIDYAVQRLGYPQGQSEMLGDTIYVWGTSRTAVMPMTSTATTTGFVGTTPIMGSQTSTTYVPMNFNCTIQLAVGPDHIIKHWHWEGNLGGCARYAQALAH
jgi:hypothetical protein